MWFHSVHVKEGLWSVTANRYYYSGSGAAGEWERTMDTKKSRDFAEYEIREMEFNGGPVC